MEDGRPAVMRVFQSEPGGIVGHGRDAAKAGAAAPTATTGKLQTAPRATARRDTALMTSAPPGATDQ
ncbi:hypothetical protein GCM10027070_12150 [Barrientosiimonas humi]